MDTITHGMIGALVGRAYAPYGPGGLTPTQCSLVGAISAVVPDLDYAVFWIEPTAFLSTWHRGPTHSLVLLPIWAVILGIALSLGLRRRDCRRDCIFISALALFSHIATDVVTVYGTAVLFPLSDWRMGLGSTVVIDGWLSGIVLAALVAGWRRPGPGFARTGLALAALYLAGEVALQREARRFALGRLGDLLPHPEQIHALAQPLSPFHWKVIVPTDDGYRTSTFRLTDFATFPAFAADVLGLGALLESYRPRRAAHWQSHPRFGDDPEQAGLAREVWEHEAMRGFRRFAVFPVLYRIDRTSTDTCVWFTDLRYDYAGMIPSFRYGLCRRGMHVPWQPYRLRRYTQNERVPL